MFDAKELIGEAIKRHGDRIALSCSFGKDSVAILHMALRFDSKIKVLFANTGVEFPETIKYKKLLHREWNLNLYETKPIKNYWVCVKDYGLPKIRKRGGRRIKCSSLLLLPKAWSNDSIAEISWDQCNNHGLTGRGIKQSITIINEI